MITFFLEPQDANSLLEWKFSIRTFMLFTLDGASLLKTLISAVRYVSRYAQDTLLSAGIEKLTRDGARSMDSAVSSHGEAVESHRSLKS